MFLENDGIISTNADHKLVFVDLFQCVTIQQYQLNLIYLDFTLITLFQYAMMTLSIYFVKTTWARV